MARTILMILGFSLAIPAELQIMELVLICFGMHCAGRVV